MDSSMETDDEERKYQKTIVFNKHLPYADQLEEEAAGKIVDIKRNLCAAVQNRDVTPGYIFWIGRLSRYAWSSCVPSLHFHYTQARW